MGGERPARAGRILRRAAEALREGSEKMARILTAEGGKPLADARAEVEFAADYLEWFSEEAARISGRAQVAPDGMSAHLVTRAPVGPCLVISPWNFPLAVPARGIAPAIAAGCTVVLRPSPLTPLSALALGQILIEAGLPEGCSTSSCHRRTTPPTRCCPTGASGSSPSPARLPSDAT